MMLSLPRMFSLFNGLPHPPHRFVQPIAAPDQRRSPPLQQDGCPGFLGAGFARFEPDLTHEIRQAVGEQAARRVEDRP
jgi:hypothetical protein